jgi:DNA-directed RNA polymerase subunit RPC12/RpoP
MPDHRRSRTEQQLLHQEWVDYLRTELVLGGFTCSRCYKKFGPSTIENLPACDECGAKLLITESEEKTNEK